MGSIISKSGELGCLQEKYCCIKLTQFKWFHESDPRYRPWGVSWFEEGGTLALESKIDYINQLTRDTDSIPCWVSKLILLLQRAAFQLRYKLTQ